MAIRVESVECQVVREPGPATTSLIERPASGGTPGARNSTFRENLGPTYYGVNHAPVIPDAFQPVTVTAYAQDPDGVASMSLFWSRDGSPFREVPMLHEGDGRYGGEIPGQRSAYRMQFYVQGVDSLSATSTYPLAGPDSRAMYSVQDSQAPANGRLDTIRLVMKTRDVNQLYAPATLMSNELLGWNDHLQRDRSLLRRRHPIERQPLWTCHSRTERELQHSLQSGPTISRRSRNDRAGRVREKWHLGKLT